MAKTPTLGEILRDARTGKGLSITKAAVALKTTRVTYRGWESFGQRPELERVPALSRFAGLSEDDIVAAIRSQAKGVWLTSARSMVPATQLVA